MRIMYFQCSYRAGLIIGLVISLSMIFACARSDEERRSERAVVNSPIESVIPNAHQQKEVLLKLEPALLHTIEYQTPSSTHNFSRDVYGDWYYRGMESVDSTAFQRYLNTISLVGTSVRTDALRQRALKELQGDSLIESVVYYMTGSVKPVIVRHYHGTDRTCPAVLTSTQTETAICVADSSREHKAIFLRLAAMIP